MYCIMQAKAENGFFFVTKDASFIKLWKYFPILVPGECFRIVAAEMVEKVDKSGSLHHICFFFFGGGGSFWNIIVIKS